MPVIFMGICVFSFVVGVIIAIFKIYEKVEKHGRILNYLLIEKVAEKNLTEEEIENIIAGIDPEM